MVAAQSEDAEATSLPMLFENGLAGTGCTMPMLADPPGSAALGMVGAAGIEPATPPV